MKRFGILLFALTAALFAGLIPAHGQDEKGSDRAKKALMQFGAKVAANDLDGVLKTVDVPFLHNINDPKKKEVIRDREGLKKPMQQLLDAFKGKGVQFEVADVISYAKVLELEGAKISKEDRKLLDEVMAKDGYALMVLLKDAGGKQLNQMVFFVASRGTEAKVVGLKD